MTESERIQIANRLFDTIIAVLHAKDAHPDSIEIFDQCTAMFELLKEVRELL